MKNKKTEVAFLRCDIMNLLVQGAKFSAQQDAGGYGTILGTQLACNLLEKIARRAFEIGDDELMVCVYQLGLVEQNEKLEKLFLSVKRKAAGKE